MMSEFVRKRDGLSLVVIDQRRTYFAENFDARVVMPLLPRIRRVASGLAMLREALMPKRKVDTSNSDTLAKAFKERLELWVTLGPAG